MPAKTLVTGATGNVGAEVVKSLQQLGQSVVTATMNEQDAQQVPVDPNTSAVRFDFGDPTTYPAAFAGVSKLFLMRPPQISNVKRYLFPVIDYAKQVGVEQIVFLSLIGVERNPVVPHHKVEKYILTSGVPYTFVRPSFYMQNLNTTHRVEIRDQNIICVPVGRAKTSFIDVRDIGAVAAKVLTENEHQNKAYELTGSEALDYYQVAELFTDILGRKITYRNPSVFEFIRVSRARGIPWAFVMVMVGLYTSTRFGMAKQITRDVQNLLGRQPIRMQQYIQDYAETWLVSANQPVE